MNFPDTLIKVIYDKNFTRLMLQMPSDILSFSLEFPELIMT
jgi:hypothetical protein